MRGLAFAVFSVGLGVTTAAAASTADDLLFDPTQLSFEDLINTTITSVSKKAERLQDAAAAIFVLTNEDIRRAHVKSIPDALRLVPGMQVNQADNGSYTVSSRGFGGNVISANKLLVLIDGRSIYNPLFGGVIWEAQSVVLEDVDRIEVIRGPGGTLWGNNAVNGVINILTKTAGETQGGLLVAGAGSEEKALGVLRYGGNLGDEGNYRVYLKHRSTGQSFNSGANASDDFRDNQGGFRIDFARENATHTLQGDYYDNAHGSNNTGVNTHYYGGNLLYRQTRNLNQESSYTIQAYWDYTELEQPGFDESRDTLDFDFQYNYDPVGMHDLVWGLNYRYIGDHVVAAGVLSHNPVEREDTIVSAFLQDELTLSDSLQVILGGKVEENDFTGGEFQPNARFSYQLGDQKTLWGGISKAVRVPTRLESDIPSGDKTLNAEELIAYELGYRAQPVDTFSFDTVLFLHDYEQLIFFESIAAPPFFRVANAAEGKSWGLEFSGRWQARPNWLVDVTYTFTQMRLEARDDHTAILFGANQATVTERSDPANRATIFSRLDLNERTEFDAILRYADNIYAGGGTAVVPSYVELDLGLTFKLQENVDLELAGRNLLDSHHREVLGAGSNEIQRSVHGTVTWKF